MQALREIIDSEELGKIIDLPNEFKHRKLELVVLPLTETEDNKKITKSAKGLLKKYKNVSLVKEEKGAWEKAMVEKHGNS